MTLSGLSFIGFQRGAATGQTSRAVAAATGEPLAPDFHAPTPAEVERSVALATQAADVLRGKSGAEKAALLRRIAENIEKLGDVLTARAVAETGLAEGRIKMETGRTCLQLRLFASLVEEGSWLDARIDHGDPQRQPLPKPDLRCMHRALGPVVVFCASNFPLAYSVAGGDTASALAAGCPVIVKAHSSHPGTSELVATAVVDAVKACGFPEGTFSVLFGGGRDVGQVLVKHPGVKAVGFTGSRAGGKTLMDLAAARPEPIPVYAEMSSVNPVFLLDSALQERATAIATGLHGSATLGCGQFCTNPGLVIVDATSSAAGAFREEFVRLMAATPPATMLNATICSAYQQGVAAFSNHPSVKVLAQVPSTKTTGGAAVFETTGAAFLADHALCAEVFGPATLLVMAQGAEEMKRIAESLEGQLTATVHASAADLAAQSDLLAILERKAGRLIYCGFPTGVEVNHSIVHGGPFPATSDGRSTSVGPLAIYRFTRLVAYQNFPDAALPPELQDANPLKIRRRTDGVIG